MACVEGALKDIESWLMILSILAAHLRTFLGLSLLGGGGGGVPGRKRGVKTGESPRIMGDVYIFKLNEGGNKVLDNRPGTLEGSAILGGSMA